MTNERTKLIIPASVPLPFSPMAGGVDSGVQYSPLAGFIFAFNLIVGAGALALPLAFQQSGLVRRLPFLPLLLLRLALATTRSIVARIKNPLILFYL